MIYKDILRELDSSSYKKQRLRENAIAAYSHFEE